MALKTNTKTQLDEMLSNEIKELKITKLLSNYQTKHLNTSQDMLDKIRNELLKQDVLDIEKAISNLK